MDSAVALKPIVQRQKIAPTLERRSPIDDLLDLTLAAEAADCEHRRGVHGEQHRRSIEKGDREHVERIIEQVAVADRKCRGPVEMREDAERYRLRPGTHQHRPDETKYQIEPDRGSEGPCDMRAQAEGTRPRIDPRPPQQDGGGQEETRHQPPAALCQRRDVQTVGRRRRLECQPEQLAAELHDAPVHRSPHVQADDLESDEAADEGSDAGLAEIDRPDLRIAEQAEEMREERKRRSAPSWWRGSGTPI